MALKHPYIDLDQLIDIEGFKSLEDDMMAGIARSAKKIPFFYGPGCITEPQFEHKVCHLGDAFTDIEKRPKEYAELKAKFSTAQMREYLGLRYRSISYSYVVSLREGVSGGYDGISNAKDTAPTANLKNFPNVVKYIETLPFREIGRIEIFLSPSNVVGHLHSDGIASVRQRAVHEFIWLRTNLDKNFYVIDEVTKERSYIRSYSAFFDSLVPHGSDSTPFQTFSLRVDGHFTDEFRAELARLDAQPLR